MRSLILGGAGFIGSHLAERLRHDGHKVVTVDLDPGADLVADLTQPGIWPWLSREVDHVYMLAAIVGVAVVEHHPQHVLNVNTRTVQRLLEWLPPMTRLFFASSSEVYAGSVLAGVAPVPTPEQVPLSVPDLSNPRFAYATSKILGEAAILYSGANAVTGRFHNIYGPRMHTDAAIPALTRRLASTMPMVPIYGPEQTRAFCYVTDAVDAMVRVMATDYHGVVNIGNDQEITVEDLAGEIAAVLDLDDVLIQRLAAPAGSVPRRCPDLTRLRALTGYEPKVGLEEGLVETVEWVLSQ